MLAPSRAAEMFQHPTAVRAGTGVAAGWVNPRVLPIHCGGCGRAVPFPPPARVPPHPAESGSAPGEGAKRLGQQLVPSSGVRLCRGNHITQAHASPPAYHGSARETDPAAGYFPCAGIPPERILPSAGPELRVRPGYCCSLSPLDPSWGLPHARVLGARHWCGWGRGRQIFGVSWGLGPPLAGPLTPCPGAVGLGLC